jgi:hypothetical protein
MKPGGTDRPCRDDITKGSLVPALTSAIDARRLAAPLYTPHTESRYRGVYRHHSRTHPWVAKCKCRGRLRRIGKSDTRLGAALVVVRWYESRYGPRWPEALREGFRERRAPWRITHSERWGGFVLTVWAARRFVLVALLYLYGWPGAARVELWRPPPEGTGSPRSRQTKESEARTLWAA